MITIKKLEEQPEEMKVVLMEVLIMPNGEVIHLGKTFGWYDKLGKYLYVKEEQGDDLPPADYSNDNKQ